MTSYLAPSQALQTFIEAPEFPCVGAKSALRRGKLKIIEARSIDSGWDDLAIHDAILEFAWAYRAEPTLFTSLAVIFCQSAPIDESAFEEAMWARIQSLADKDAWRGQTTDLRVSDDPDDPHFSLSFGGEAFFVVGLHPKASRPARRFDHPAMIFNLHDQFEELRRTHRYDKLKEAIVERDIKLAGSPNPMLAVHGTASEARQYSGRQVGAEWRCPYRRAAVDEDVLKLLPLEAAE